MTESARLDTRPAGFVQDLGGDAWQTICGYCGYSAGAQSRAGAVVLLARHLLTVHDVDVDQADDVVKVWAR